MRFILQQPRKIGRDVIVFEMSEDKEYLEGSYKGRKVRIYKDSPDVAIIGTSNNWDMFARLGSNQVKRVRGIFERARR